MPNSSHWFVRGRLKTRQLLLLVALAEEGNIHRAAQVLSMTQPAASKLLKDLEDVLGVQLFERLPRGMRPTRYGETMIRHARVSLTSLDDAHDEVQALKDGRAGIVNIGAITTPAVSLLPIAVTLVKRDHPDLRISVDVDTSPLLLERMDQGKLDILVARLFEHSDTSGLRIESLSEEPVAALVRPGHPLLKLPAIGLHDIVGSPWIVPPAGSVLRHRFELMFRTQNLSPPTNVIETSALLFITRMIEQNDLIAVLAKDVAEYYEAHGIGAILPLSMPCRMDMFGIITRTDRLLSPAAKVMMSALKTAAAAVYGTSPNAAQTPQPRLNSKRVAKTISKSPTRESDDESLRPAPAANALIE